MLTTQKQKAILDGVKKERQRKMAGYNFSQASFKSKDLLESSLPFETASKASLQMKDFFLSLEKQFKNTGILDIEDTRDRLGEVVYFIYGDKTRQKFFVDLVIRTLTE